MTAALSLLSAATISVGLFLAALGLFEPGLRRAIRPALVAVAVAAVVLLLLGVTGTLEL